MKLYLLKRIGRCSYDEYDSLVVVAESAYNAIRIDPGEMYYWDNDKNEWYGRYKFGGKRDGERYEVDKEYYSWVDIDQIECICLGVANFNKEQVICASFNAG